ncbi:MAG: insulinase family protein [Gemmatimonadetes bacterium]|nr:insulinase family protein [Gemmatimonadota bacterium]
MKLRLLLSTALLLPLALSCRSKSPELKIDYEQYQLDNGLSVVLHQDHSDPVTAVAILYHVGSNREDVGRTGFAHLFEHMMFQSSQHVPEDQFFQIVQAAGGTLNGGTSSDQTVYYEVLPKNALETALWLESDRMGYLLPTVTTEALLNQQGVVQNEKRQGVDNRPYGQTSYMIGKLLYPEEHPYNWQVIGSFEDLANARVEDVRNFFLKWYRPNNATLVIAGDFDPANVKPMVEKYFGEIPAGDPVQDQKVWNVTLDGEKRAYYEDNFANSPELNMVFPTVSQFTPDAYALDMFGRLFASGKKAPLYKVVVEEKKLAPSVSAFQRSQEITGSFGIRIRAFPNTSLADVEAAIDEAFARFESDGFTDEDLARIKAQTETGFYNGISSVLGKSFQLAAYNEYAGSPGFITQDIQNSLDVTPEDVRRVYDEYIKGKPFVLTSFVPRGQVNLVAEGSTAFEIPADPAGLKSAAAGMEVPPVEPIPSSFDRNVEPAEGPAPTLNVPAVWTHTYANGLKIYGVEQHELPLVQFSVNMKGGGLLDDMNKLGVANLMSDIMMEGTANRTPLELEEAIDDLGAYISMYTAKQAIVLNANGLKSKAGDMVGLVQEILLEPRWDEREFARLKTETVENINRQMVNPAAVAGNVFSKLVYGSNSILGASTLGTPESVQALTIDDMRDFYARDISPSAAFISVAGDITQDEAIELFRPLEESWPAKDVPQATYPEPQPRSSPVLYFVDIPGARQSQVYVGELGPARTDPAYFAATVMNYQLGGNFNGVLNMILREEKGFTYGARSFFSGATYPGIFAASSSVQSTATRESVEIVRDEIARYREGVSQDALDYTKNALILSNARRFETLGSLLAMVNNIATYDLPFDYVRQEEETTRGMTLAEHKDLAQRFLNPDGLIYLVVGDAATQLAPLRSLGLGNPIMLDLNGDPVQ